MNDDTQRIAAGASAFGAAIFAGVFGWFYLSGSLPLGIALALVLVNLGVLVFSVMLAGRADE